MNFDRILATNSRTQDICSMAHLPIGSGRGRDRGRRLPTQFEDPKFGPFYYRSTTRNYPNNLNDSVDVNVDPNWNTPRVVEQEAQPLDQGMDDVPPEQPVEQREWGPLINYDQVFGPLPSEDIPEPNIPELNPFAAEFVPGSTQQTGGTPDQYQTEYQPYMQEQFEPEQFVSVNPYEAHFMQGYAHPIGGSPYQYQAAYQPSGPVYLPVQNFPVFPQPMATPYMYGQSPGIPSSTMTPMSMSAPMIGSTGGTMDDVSMQPPVPYRFHQHFGHSIQT